MVWRRTVSSGPVQGETTCTAPCDPSEHRPCHESRTAGIIKIEQSPYEFAGRVKAWDCIVFDIENLRICIDLQAAERKGDAAPDRIRLERRLLDGIRPVRLVHCQSGSGPAILDIGVEFNVAFDRSIVLIDGLHKRGRVHVLHALDKLFERIRQHFGGAPHFVLVAQEMHDLPVEDLPRVASGLSKDDAPVLCIGVVSEVGALIDETFAVRVDHDAERVAMPVSGAVLSVDVAVIVCVALPRDRMTAGPLAVRLSANGQSHLDAVSGVVASAAHLRHVPAWPEIARPPFAVGFETAAGQNDTSRADDVLDIVDENAHGFDAVLTPDDPADTRAIMYGDAVLRSRLIFGLDEPRPATVCVDHDAAE